MDTLRTQVTRLGPFDLLKYLRSGGMGAVWLAEHRATRTQVAVKVLHPPEDESRETTGAFLREVRAVAYLDHPGVVEILDYGVIPETIVSETPDGEATIEAGSRYLVMEFISGPEAAVVDDWNEARRYLLSMLDTLAYCHARGVIHRDLKPSNLLCTDHADYPIKLVDFGIASLPGGLKGVRQSRVQGTPAYMSPEQVVGDHRRQGPWSDLYAVGCVAYQWISGEPPFPYDTAERVLDSHMEAPFPPLEARFPIPDGVEAWIQQLTARNARDRCLHAVDAREALEALGEVAPPKPSKARRRRPGRRTVARSAPRQTQSARSTFDVSSGHRERYTTMLTGDLASGSTRRLPPMSTDEFTPRPRLGSVETRLNRARQQLTQRARLPRSGLSLLSLREPAFVGRDTELDQAWTVLREAIRTEHPHVLWVRGLPGVGTTTFASKFTEGAASNGVVHVVHAVISERQDAIRALERAASAALYLHLEADKNVPLVIKGLARERGTALNVADMIALLRWEQQGPLPAVSDAERFRNISQALAWAAQERPLLVWIGDTDGHPSAEAFLHFAMRSPLLDRERVLFVATGHEAPSQIDCEPRFIDLELEPLAPDEVRELIAGFCDLSPELVPRVVDYSTGIPSAVVGLLTTWHSRGALIASGAGVVVNEREAIIPPTIKALWYDRITAAHRRALDRVPVGRRAAVSQQWYRAFEIGALLGEDSHVNVWQQVCACEGVDATQAWIDDMVRARLAWARGDRWGLSQRSARARLIESAEAAGRLQTHHRHIAHTLMHNTRSTSPAEQLRIAEHLLYGGDRDRARHFAMQVLRAHSFGPFSTTMRRATRFFRKHFLDDPQTTAALALEAELLMEDAGLLSRGQRTDAVARATDKLARADALGDPVLRAKSLVQLAHAHNGESAWDAALEAGQTALNVLLDAEVYDDWTVDAASTASYTLGMLRQANVALILLSETTARTSTWQPQHLFRLALAESIAAHHAGDGARSLRAARIMYRFLGNVRNEHAKQLGLTQLAVALRAMGQLEDAEIAYAEALEFSKQLDRFDVFSEFNLLMIGVRSRQSLPEIRRITTLIEHATVDANPVIALGARLMWLARAAKNRDWDAWDDILARVAPELRARPIRSPDFTHLLSCAARRAREAGRLNRAADAERLINDVEGRLDRDP